MTAGNAPLPVGSASFRLRLLAAALRSALTLAAGCTTSTIRTGFHLERHNVAQIRVEGSQPVVRVECRGPGTLVVYMRENGPLDRVRVAESKDDGISWGKVGGSDLPNPGSGLDGIRLANGR